MTSLSQTTRTPQYAQRCQWFLRVQQCGHSSSIRKAKIWSKKVLWLHLFSLFILKKPTVSIQSLHIYIYISVVSQGADSGLGCPPWSRGPVLFWRWSEVSLLWPWIIHVVVVFQFNKLCMLHVSLVCSTSHGTATSIRNSGLNLESQTLTASGKRPELDSI